MFPRLPILAVLGTLALAGTLSAQTALEPIADKVRAEALTLPADTPLVVLNPSDTDNPRSIYTVHRTFAADGSFTADWKGPRSQVSSKFRPDGTLVSSRQTDLVRKSTLEERVSPDRNSVQTVITVNGTVNSDKRSDLKPGLVLREELDHVVRQAWGYGIRDGLLVQSLSPDGGMTGDAQILFVQTADPLGLSTKYAYPIEFRTALASRNAYVVADLSLQGIAALFMPHHFYFIYVPTASGLEFAAYFGEDPKKPTYQWVTKN